MRGGVEQQVACDTLVPHRDRSDFDLHDALVLLALHRSKPDTRQVGRDRLDGCQNRPCLGNAQPNLAFVIQVHRRTPLAASVSRPALARYSRGEFGSTVGLRSAPSSPPIGGGRPDRLLDKTGGGHATHVSLTCRHSATSQDRLFKGFDSYLPAAPPVGGVTRTQEALRRFGNPRSDCPARGCPSRRGPPIPTVRPCEVTVSARPPSSENPPAVTDGGS